jgi:hypothetical protein
MAETLRGMGELSRKLANLDAATRGKAIERALLVGAQPVRNQAVEDAPVKTGNLRRSIHTEVGVQTGNTIVYVGTDVDYAWAQEVRKPYLRPALDQNVDEVRREVIGALRDLVMDAVK